MKYKQLELYIATVLLTISAVASLVLSGAATYQFFLPFGKVIAISAVLAVEVGIPGAVFTWRSKRRQTTGFFGGVSIIVSVVLAMVVAMGANLLFKIDTLGIVMNERFLNLARLVTTTIIIPLLAFFSVERLREALSVVMGHTILEEVLDTTPNDRIEYYIQTFGNIKDVPVMEMAEKYDRSEVTIRRDLVEMEERMKTF